MSEINWKEPEPRGNRMSAGTQALLQAGIARPNEWFLLFEGNRHRPASKHFKGSSWQRAYRKVATEGGVIYRTYVRYIGE